MKENDNVVGMTKFVDPHLSRKKYNELAEKDVSVRNMGFIKWFMTEKKNQELIPMMIYSPPPLNMQTSVYSYKVAPGEIKQFDKIIKLINLVGLSYDDTIINVIVCDKQSEQPEQFFILKTPYQGMNTIQESNGIVDILLDEFNMISFVYGEIVTIYPTIGGDVIGALVELQPEIDLSWETSLE